ncbi:MAG: cohesin domain-containing protein [Pyrinomonadaceae bacterium]
MDSENSIEKQKPITVAAQHLAASADKEIVIPVSVQGVADKGVISYEFDLRYDPTVLQPLENPVDVAGTVSRGLSVVTNATEPGLLRVVVYGAFSIESDGVLLNLRFTAVGSVLSASPLTFERIMFNEGEAGVSVADGRIELF